MSGSNRSGNTKAIDWAFPLTGIILGLFLAWGIGWLQAREEYNRKQTPAAYAEAANNDAESSCVGTEPRAVFECVNEKAKTAYQTAHDEQDLSAQQRAASSALVTAILSGIALILSGVGVWYVKRTLDATLEAVEDTGKATKAMENSNSIAVRRNELELRPYLGLDGENATIELDPKVDADADDGVFVGFKIKIVFRNFGNTPAKRVTWSWNILVINDGVEIPFVTQFKESHNCLDIPPTDTHTGIIPYQVEDKLVEMVESGKTNIHLFNRITYEGLDGTPHVLQVRLFCNNHALWQGVWGSLSEGFIST